MKIIKEGIVPLDQTRSWWWGMQMTCPKCGQVMELEEGDNPKILIERSMNGRRVISVICPKCNTVIVAPIS